MEQDQDQVMNLHKRYNGLFALMVLAVTLATYLFTVSPSVAFWDCGEYIGASHTLGVPHPPGNPLFVLLGRFFSMTLFFFSQVAFRINLISVISGALTAMLIYLIIVRTTVSWLGIPDSSWKRITVYLGGVVGGLFCAFGDTFWFSAVETSVYVPAMLVVALGTWLSLVWAQSKEPNRDVILLLVAYLTFLGIGVHMMAMLAMVPIFLFIMLSDHQKLKDWRLWVTVLLMSTVIYQVSNFIIFGPVTAAITLVMSLVGGPNQRKWRFCFWIAFFGLLGYSVHLYIPIRSALQPMIDENHPATWEAFKQFLERKQYGSENMLLRMFHRRGAWSKQLGIDAHMGYGGFHLTQFFRFSSLDTRRSFLDGTGLYGALMLLIYLIPTFFMIFGWRYLYRKNKVFAVFLVFLVVATTVGMVLFMNFADGTRAERQDYLMWIRRGKPGPMPTVHREVRIRDYFFTPGLVFFGMWMGISATCLLHWLFVHKKEIFRTSVAPACVVLFALSPLLPLTQNYAKNNRTGDWIPYDYAYNLLMSCDKEGIIFTNGDNDTFPLWFLQEAEGIRRDVRVVNLSLLNTKWYIRQLKNLEPKVAISYSETELDALNHELNPFEKDARIRTPISNIIVTVPGRERMNALRVQDKMVLNIVDSNRWRKPVYFAVTVSNDNKMGLDPYLRMEGLAYRVMPGVVPPQESVDIDRTVYMLDNVYRFRGLGDGTAVLNETTEKLLSNYAAGYIQVALSLREPLERLRIEIEQMTQGMEGADSALSAEKDGEPGLKRKKYEEMLDLAVVKMDQCVGLMPWDWRPRTLRHELLMRHGRAEEAERRVREALIIEPEKTDYLKMLVQALQEQGKEREANDILRRLLRADSDPWYAYVTLAQKYVEKGMFDSAIAVIREFKDSHPGDQRAASLLARYEAMMRQRAAPLIDTGMKTVPEKVHEPKG